MVEELKLAIKIDDDAIEQSLLKQFNNAEKMADKVVLTFKNVNLDDKNIEAKFKEMQKMAGKNPIDLSINDKSVEMLSAISKQLSNIFEIAKGKSLIDSSSTVSDIGKIANATNQQVDAVKKTTSAYKNQAYELASVLKMLEKMDRFNETPYAGAMSRAVKAHAKSYKKDDIIQFLSKDYGIPEDALKQLRGLSVNLEEAFNYTDTLGLDTATIKNIEILIQYFRELLKEKLEFNNIKLNTADVEELIKALGIAKKEVFDDGTGKKINSYDGYLNKYSSVSEITAYLKQQEQQALATAEAEQKLVNAEQQSSNSSFAENQDKIQQELKETEQIAEQTAETLEKVNSNGNKSNISSGNANNANIESQKQNVESIVKFVDNYGRELDEVNSKLLEGTALLDKQGKLIRLYHGSDVEFDKFDLSKSTNPNNQIYGKGAYLIENEKGAQGYGNVVTQWYANVRAVLNEEQQLTLEEAKKLYSEFGNQFMSIFTGKPMDFNEFFDNYLDFNPDETTIVEKMKSFAAFLGKDIGEVLSTIGYDAIKMERDNGTFYTIFDPDRVIRFKDETQKAVNVVNDLNKAQTNSTIEDVFQEEKIGQTTSSAKELDKALERVNIPTESFDEVLSKLDLSKSKLTEIVKITKQARADKDGKFYESFTLTDKNGSYETYGENSKTDSGQLLDAKYVQYDAKAQAKAEEQESKRLVEENIRLNKAYYDGKKKDEKEYQRLRKQYQKEGEAQAKAEELSAQKAVKTDWEENVKTIEKFIDAKSELNNIKAKEVGDEKHSNWYEDQVRKIEELSPAYEAAKNAVLDYFSSAEKIEKIPATIEEILDVISKLNSETNGSSESFAKLQDAIANVNNSELQSLDKYIESAQKKLNTTNASRDDSEKSLDFKNYVSQAQKHIDDIIAEKQRLESALESGDIEIIDKSDLTGIDDIKQKLANLNLEYKTMFKGSADVSRWKEIDTITKYMEKNTRISKEAKIQFQGFIEELKTKGADANVEKIHQSFLEVCDVERKARREGKSFLDVLRDKVWYQWVAQIGTYFSFNDIIRYGKEGIETVRELDTALTEMRKVSDESVQSLKNYQASTFDVADAVGTTAAQIQNSTADYMRLGESIDEASESARVANILLNVSEFDSVSEATDSLVAMGQAYKDLDKIEIVDKLNEVGRRIIAQTYGNVWHILYMLYLGKSVKILGKDKTEILF